MRLLKQALAVLGALVVVAVMVALVVPKQARAVENLLVTITNTAANPVMSQIVPGIATHVGQKESQLVSLICFIGNSSCDPIDPEGNGSTSSANGYVVPTGYTLIVTDYQFSTSGGPDAAGTFISDNLQNNNSGKANLAQGTALADKLGNAYGHEHYATGIRVGSGVMIQDLSAAVGGGSAQVQGYLVPND